MLTTVALLLTSLTLISSSGEGNIRLLEDEVATALRACSYNESSVPKRNSRINRRRRSDDYNYQGYGIQTPRIDDETKQNENLNLYNNGNHNSRRQMHVLNCTENNIPSYGRFSLNLRFVRAIVLPSVKRNCYSTNLSRNKRSGSFLNKTYKDQCLSQCVFANLQVVDGRGIPREAELWNKIQSAVTSRLSRTVLKDQIRACFQELQAEAEDNGCSYSNKLERCLMLRFSDRKINQQPTNN